MFKLNQNFKLFILYCCGFQLISCSPTISHFNLYQKSPLLETEFMPSEDAVEGKKTKVVVFEFEDGGETAKIANLNDSLTTNTESAITEDMVVEIVDRSAAQKMKQEIELTEINKGSGAYKGPIIADYAISGSISNASFSSQFIEESVGYNPVSGTYYKIPAKFKYRSNVSGNLKIYEMPSVKVVKNLSFSGSESRTENAPTKTESAFFGLSQKREILGGQKMDTGLMNEAAREGISSIKADLKNFFAKKGYILEKRKLKNKTIFKISVGSVDGIKQGDKLIIIQKRSDKNAITGKSEISEFTLGEGVVSDQITSNSAWIIIKDKNIVNLIRLGDFVKVQYTKGLFTSIKNAVD